MMKKLSLFSVSILFFVFHPNNKVFSQQRSQGLSEAQLEIVSVAMKPLPVNTQFSIAVINDGKPVFFGFQKTKDTVVTIVNHQKAFEIGSISKVFTSTLLAEMVVAGKVKLDGNFYDGLELPVKDNQQISFQQLANHTSGLPRLPTNLILFAVDPANPYKDYDEAKLKEYLATGLKVAQEPGKKYEYSNLAVGLLGYVISKIENKTYEELLQQKIFGRFGMINSTTDRSKIESRLVKGVGATGDEVKNWDLAVLVGAGGILSTTEDLAKFAKAQFDESNKALSLTRQKTFDVNENMSIGLGWHIIKDDGRELYNHNGGTGGYRSSMTIDPKTKRGIVVLSNLTAFHSDSKNIDILCRDLLKSIQK